MDVVKNARKTNESMSDFVINSLLSLSPNINKNTKIGILGYSYKSNSDDIRNTKTDDLIKKLKKITNNIVISDYIVNNKINTMCGDNMENLDVLIVTIDHDLYKKYDEKYIESLFNKKSNIKILMDLKSIYKDYNFKKNISYWKL